MTGYGHGEATVDGVEVNVEISSYNRKQTDIRIHLPKDFLALERTFRDRVSKRIGRGAVTVKTSVMTNDDSDVQAEIDVNLIRNVLRELQRVGSELDVGDDVTLRDILAIPNLAIVKPRKLDADKISESMLTALGSALEDLTEMKVREGATLREDFESRIASLFAMHAGISDRAPTVPETYRQKLLSRLDRVLDGATLEDERILTEIALFADRCDISEEITRISSHLEHMQQVLNKTSPVGRKLDFLVQELFREINTVGAKCNDLDIAGIVIEFKTELDRIREQVQNIE